MRFREVEQARAAGHQLTFYVTKVNRRRWNWVLKMRYTSQDDVTGQDCVHKVLLRTAKAREPLEMIRAELAAYEPRASDLNGALAMRTDDVATVDLLALLHDQVITLDDAYHRFEDAIDRFHRGEPIPPWNTLFRFSGFEATAYTHGAGLEDLVTLRYQGWPTTCCYCHQPLDYQHVHWWFVGRFFPGHTPGERADPANPGIEDGVMRLSHVTCMPTYDDETYDN